MFSLKRLLAGKPFNLIFFGVILHTLGIVLSTIFSSVIITVIFGVFGWLYIFKGLFRIRGYSNPFHGFYKFVLVLYLVVTSIMIARGLLDGSITTRFHSTQQMINHLFFQPSYLICYFLPIIVFIPTKYYSLKIPAAVSPYMGIATLFLCFFVFPMLLRNSTMRAMGLNVEDAGNISLMILYSSFTFMALCSAYLTPRVNFWNIIGVVVSLLMVLVGGRRGNSVTFAIILVLALYAYVKSRKKRKYRFFLYIIVSIFIVFCVYYFINSSMFAFIHERGFEDTRTNVEVAFLNQMSEMDMIFGKGLNGKYYHPTFVDTIDNGWRYIVETGFYNYVLKGGYLMMIPYIYLFLVASYKGIFKSKNQLCKMGGIYLFLSILELYPYGHFMFNTKFFILWMLLPLCMSKVWRNYSDGDIKKFLFS